MLILLWVSEPQNSACALNPDTDCLANACQLHYDNVAMETTVWQACLSMNVSGNSAGQVKEFPICYYRKQSMQMV